jgi:hypothetical protein
MANDTIGSVVAVVKATSAQFSSDINEIKNSLSGLKSHADGLNIGDAFKLGGAIEIAKTAIDAATEAVERFFAAFEQAHQLENLAQQVGSTASELSGLHFAALEVGSSAETVDQAIGKMVQKIGDAREGGEKTSVAFKALGLDINKLSQESAGEAVKDIADAFQKVPNHADQAALAVELFGKRGRELIPLLDQGRAGIEAFITKGKEMGAVLTEDQVGAMVQAETALKEMQAAWSGLVNELAAAVAPILKEIVGILSDIVRGVHDAIHNLAAFFTGDKTADELRKEAAEHKKREEAAKIASDNIVKKLKEEEKAHKQLQEEAKKAAKEADEAAKKVEERGRRVAESVREPMERFNETFYDLKNLLDAGAISMQTFERAALKAASEVEKANKVREDTVRLTGGVAAADVNTTAGASLQLTAARASRDIANAEKTNAEEQLIEAHRHTELLKDIKAAIGGVGLNIAEADF